MGGTAKSHGWLTLEPNRLGTPPIRLQMRWSAQAWSVVRVEFRRALAVRSKIRALQYQAGITRSTRLMRSQGSRGGRRSRIYQPLCGRRAGGRVKISNKGEYDTK